MSLCTVKAEYVEMAVEEKHLVVVKLISVENYSKLDGYCHFKAYNKEVFQIILKLHVTKYACTLT